MKEKPEKRSSGPVAGHKNTDGDDSMFVRWGKQDPFKHPQVPDALPPGAPETAAEAASKADPETAAEPASKTGPETIAEPASREDPGSVRDTGARSGSSRRSRGGKSGKAQMENPVPRAILAGCNTGTDAEKYAREIAELRGLAKACGLDPVMTITQNADAVTHATYLGSGKVAELRREVETLDADIVLFNEALTPMQMRNLEKELDTEVLDRTGLILQIFASRARTREAKLQVESARLQYMLPRLVGMRAQLSRQGGGSGRLSNKGAGEQKLELDRRRIEKRISDLRRELEIVDRERATQRSRRLRTGLTRVALVGYTNAGKSTVMNALLDYSASPGREAAARMDSMDTAAHTDDQKGNGSTFLRQQPDSTGTPEEGKRVFQADMLFATLDTAVRRIDAPGHLPFLLSDTVGFVSDLPHALVKAFRSTLEEVRYADLLLEVVDFSDPDYREQIEVTAKTLQEIGAGHVPVVYLYNKVDLVPAREATRSRPVPGRIPFRRGDTLYLAAGKGIGIPEILDLIDSALDEGRQECGLLIPYSKGAVLQEIRQCGVLLKEEYLPEGILVRARCRRDDIRRLEKMLGKIQHSQ
ncbi:MAG: GTPase HflX [Eubacteriales bacterium]|nr:GTPase HflX [Eubacteriales bacterium]